MQIIFRIYKLKLLNMSGNSPHQVINAETGSNSPTKKSRKQWCCASGKKREPLSAWLKLLCVVCSAIFIGIYDTFFPIAYDYAATHYNVSRPTIALTTSAYIGGLTGIGLLTNPLINLHRSGTRIVGVLGSLLFSVGNLLAAISPNVACYIISFGLISGCGVGNMLMAINLTVCSNFQPNRGLATGIVSLGFAVGTVLSPVIVNFLLDKYGLSGTLLVLSGMYANTIMLVLAATVRTTHISSITYEDPDLKHQSLNLNEVIEQLDSDDCNQVHVYNTNDIEMTSMTATKVKDKPKSAMKEYFIQLCKFSLLRQLKFNLLAGTIFFVHAGRVCLITYSVNRALNLGVETHQAAYITSIMGMVNIVLRVPTTVMLNFRAVDELIVHAIGVAALVAGLFIFGAAQSYAMIAASMTCVGILEGVSMTALPLAVMRCCDLEDLPKALSLMMFISGIGSFLTVPLAGWLIDLMDSYKMTFFIAGVIGIVALSLNILLIVLRHPANASVTKNDRRATHI